MCVYMLVHYTQVLAPRQISIQECHAYRFQGYESKMWVQMRVATLLFVLVHSCTYLFAGYVCMQIYTYIHVYTHHIITLEPMLNKAPVRTSLVVTA